MSSRTIPEPIKREVRQACRFACVVCGCPLYEYDHIEDFSREQEHRPHNLVLLCPTHHRMKTNRLISKDDIRKYRDAARSRPSTAWERLFVEPRLLDVGSNECFTTDYFFVVAGRHWLGAKAASSEPLLQGRITDENGRALAEIINGQISFSSDNWDVEFTGREIIIRNAPRSILLRLTLSSDSKGIVLRGRPPLYDDSRLDIQDDGIYYRGNLLARSCTAYNLRCALFVVERDSDPMPLAGFLNAYNAEECIVHNSGPDAAGFVWSNDFLKSLH